MTSISKDVSFDKLDDIANEYNNTYHRTIKLKPTDAKNNTYIKDPKFQIGDHVRISKSKSIFAKGHTQSQSEGVFVIKLKNTAKKKLKKAKNTVPWTYAINDINGEELIEIFYREQLQKQIEKNL